MSTKTIDINSLQIAKESLRGLLAKDDEIVLTDAGKPLARLTRIDESTAPQKVRIPDLFPGIVMSDDFTDPLPDKFWLGDSE
jgi:antitoxin (DNA-binding transcriptional repressor) of toxin-antitoxin stability system